MGRFHNEDNNDFPVFSDQTAKMDMKLGAPIAYGRTAEIYPWQDNQILKLFHDWFVLPNIEYEQRIAQAVHASGLPVPYVGEIVEVNGRNGLIYQRVAGVSMLEKFSSQPWRLFNFARRLAALHAAMHSKSVTAAIPNQHQRTAQKIKQVQLLPDSLRYKMLAALKKLPPGNQICHGDFHPDNIMVTDDADVIIDWIDATLGNPLADVARTTIITLGAVATEQIPHPIVKLLIRLFHKLYLRHYFALRPGGEQEYAQWLPVIAAARLSENIPELEKWLIEQVEG